MNFSEVLDRLMKDYDIKASELARYLSYDPSNISKWRNGDTLPWEKNQEDILYNIAKYISLKTSASSLEPIMKMVGRKILIKNKDDLVGVIYSLLQDGYYKSSSKSKSLYNGREEFSLMNHIDILNASKELILRYISHSKSSAEIYFTSDIFEYLLKSGFFNYNNYIVHDIYFANHISTNKGVNMMDMGEQKFLNFLNNSMLRNDIYYWNEKKEINLEYIYCKGAFVLTYVQDEQKKPLMMNLILESEDKNKSFMGYIKKSILDEFADNKIISRQTNSHDYIEQIISNIKTKERIFISNNWIVGIFMNRDQLDSIFLEYGINNQHYFHNRKDLDTFISLNKISFIFDEEKLESFIKNQFIVLEGRKVKLSKILVEKILSNMMDIYDKHYKEGLEFIMLNRIQSLPFAYYESFVATDQLLIFSGNPDLVDSITQNYSIKYLPSTTKRFHNILQTRRQTGIYELMSPQYFRELINYLLDINNY